MNRITAASAVALLAAALTQQALATAAANTATTSIPVDPATQIEMHVNANCVQAQNRCNFDTTADLLTASRLVETALGRPNPALLGRTEPFPGR